MLSTSDEESPEAVARCLSIRRNNFLRSATILSQTYSTIGGLLFDCDRPLWISLEMTRTLAISKYDLSCRINRAITTGQLRSIASCEANLYRSASRLLPDFSIFVALPAILSRHLELEFCPTFASLPSTCSIRTCMSMMVSAVSRRSR